jgi:hypothetical protein
MNWSPGPPRPPGAVSTSRVMTLLRGRRTKWPRVLPLRPAHDREVWILMIKNVDCVVLCSLKSRNHPVHCLSHSVNVHTETPGPKATSSRGASMRRAGIHHNSPALGYSDPSHLQRGHPAQLLLDCLQTQPLPNAWFDRLRPLFVTPCCPVALHETRRYLLIYM